VHPDVRSGADAGEADSYTAWSACNETNIAARIRPAGQNALRRKPLQALFGSPAAGKIQILQRLFDPHPPKRAINGRRKHNTQSASAGHPRNCSIRGASARGRVPRFGQFTFGHPPGGRQHIRGGETHCKPATELQLKPAVGPGVGRQTPANAGGQSTAAPVPFAHSAMICTGSGQSALVPEHERHQHSKVPGATAQPRHAPPPAAGAGSSGKRLYHPAPKSTPLCRYSVSHCQSCTGSAVSPGALRHRFQPHQRRPITPVKDCSGGSSGRLAGIQRAARS